jgi:hypothetical protein
MGNDSTVPVPSQSSSGSKPILEDVLNQTASFPFSLDSFIEFLSQNDQLRPLEFTDSRLNQPSQSRLRSHCLRLSAESAQTLPHSSARNGKLISLFPSLVKDLRMCGMSS